MLHRRTVLLGLGASAVAKGVSAANLPRPTPHEILGPFYPLRKPSDQDADLTRVSGRSEQAAGEVIEVLGRVLWRDGSPAAGTQIEIWQANAAGKYAHPHDRNDAPVDPNFQGFARISSGPAGRFRFRTVRPGPYPGGNGGRRTPHVHFDFTAADYRLITQMYFPGEPLNDSDELLARMAARGIDPRLLIAAALVPGERAVKRYEWNVVLR